MKVLLCILLILTLACTEKNPPTEVRADQYLIVLGIAQDAGFPQADCNKANCELVWSGKEEPRHATSLGLVDKQAGEIWMIDATPDFREQLHMLQQESGMDSLPGIFLTHAHIGHFSGLMHLGHEAISASKVPVHSMPRMRYFLRNNGPWSQLVSFNNITLREQRTDSALTISDNLTITPFLVPHRDEYSETVGFRIESPSKKILFIPDINKWEAWDRDIIDEIAKVDLAIVDGTFFNENELPGRDMSKIPHPFVAESLELFEGLSDSEKSKIIFIHFNHTNPLILNSAERNKVEDLGYKVAYEGMKIAL